VDPRWGLAATLALAVGCGGGGPSAPKPISGPAKEVADVVARLQKATARQDFATICDDLLAAATRSQAGGADCVRVLGERAGSVRRPRIVVQAIEVDGNSAQARVRTTARGQAATTDVIRLIREGGRFRISALGR
jgi:hypothetical protein